MSERPDESASDDLYDLADVTIRRVAVSEMNNNAYVVTAKATGIQVLIDAAAEPKKILAVLADAEADARTTPELRAILTTHSHWDHVRALADIAHATGAIHLIGTADADGSPHPADGTVEDGDVLTFDGFELEAIGLRGHTPGSTAFLLRDQDGPAHLFSGDSLFPGGVGRTTTPGDFVSLLDDVSARLFDELPDDTIVHPGHGTPTTIGAERPQLDEWRERGW